MTRRPSVYVAAACVLVAAAVGVATFALTSRSTQAPAGPSSGEDARETPLAKSDVDPIVQPLVDNDYAGALVIGVVNERGPRVFGYGSLSPDHPLPPDGRTVFPIGCLTEAFTGSLLAIAAHRGDVKLDEPVTACLPADVVLPPVGREKMTWARIAAHTSRLPESDDLKPRGLSGGPPVHSPRDVCGPSRLGFSAPRTGRDGIQGE